MIFGWVLGKMLHLKNELEEADELIAESVEILEDLEDSKYSPVIKAYIDETVQYFDRDLQAEFDLKENPDV